MTTAIAQNSTLSSQYDELENYFLEKLHAISKNDEGKADLVNLKNLRNALLLHLFSSMVTIREGIKPLLSVPKERLMETAYNQLQQFQNIHYLLKESYYNLFISSYKGNRPEDPTGFVKSVATAILLLARLPVHDKRVYEYRIWESLDLKLSLFQQSAN